MVSAANDQNSPFSLVTQDLHKNTKVVQRSDAKIPGSDVKNVSGSLAKRDLHHTGGSRVGKTDLLHKEGAKNSSLN